MGLLEKIIAATVLTGICGAIGTVVYTERKRAVECRNTAVEGIVTKEQYFVGNDLGVLNSLGVGRQDVYSIILNMGNERRIYAFAGDKAKEMDFRYDVGSKVKLIGCLPYEVVDQ